MDIKAKIRLAVLAIVLACAIPAQATDDRVQYLGNYINVQSATGEHCEGYSVRLWRHKGSIIGFLNHHRGLCGDPPIGIMEDISYSAESGDLAFKVKLSDSLTLKADKWVPSRDLVEFEGSLKGDILQGALTWYRDGGQKPYTEDVVLPKKDEGSWAEYHAKHYSYETYDDWMKYWERILKSSRGPKW